MSDDPTSPLQQFDGPPVDPRFRRAGPRLAGPKDVVGSKSSSSLVVGAAVVGGCLGLLYSPVVPCPQRGCYREHSHARRPRCWRRRAWPTTDGDVLMVDAGPPSARQALDALPWVARGHLRAAVALDVVIKARGTFARGPDRLGHRRRRGRQERPGPRARRPGRPSCQWPKSRRLHCP